MLRLPTWYDEMYSMVMGNTPINGATAHVASALTRLSNRFNHPLPLVSERSTPYLDDRSSLRAYFSYFTAANCLKLLHPLDELLREGFFEKRRELSVLDIGCGPGTALIGLHTWLDETVDALPWLELVRYRGLDPSAEALSFALGVHSFTKHLRGRPRFEFTTDQGRLATVELRPASFDLIVMGNVLNELDASTVDRLPRFLDEILANAGRVLVIEPALRETSRAMLGFRDRMIGKGWAVTAPCFRQGTCPALESPRDWCHHDQRWERPSWLERLDHALGNAKLSLKYNYVILGRLKERDTEQDSCDFRVVSAPFHEKGRVRMFLCSEGGRRLFLLNRRDSTPANADFNRLGRYDAVHIEGAEHRKNDIRITKETVVRKLGG
ncbi:MAG: small ribosomal subunit Rsm22 family protein [Bacteroidota bacterium]|nr:small ribosomal subunit Rsm22 family protein [Bacteroidota bacterium]